MKFYTNKDLKIIAGQFYGIADILHLPKQCHVSLEFPAELRIGAEKDRIWRDYIVFAGVAVKPERPGDTTIRISHIVNTVRNSLEEYLDYTLRQNCALDDYEITEIKRMLNLINSSDYA